MMLLHACFQACEADGYVSPLPWLLGSLEEACVKTMCTQKTNDFGSTKSRGFLGSQRQKLLGFLSFMAEVELRAKLHCFPCVYCIKSPNAKFCVQLGIWAVCRIYCQSLIIGIKLPNKSIDNDGLSWQINRSLKQAKLHEGFAQYMLQKHGYYHHCMDCFQSFKSVSLLC